MNLKNNIIKASIALIVVLGVNYLGSKIYSRHDITEDSRYTLSEASKETVTTDEPIYVDVFLTGDMPSEFKRLQTETKQLLEEFTEVNDNIIISYVNPKDENPNVTVLTSQMETNGMQALRVDAKENRTTSQEFIFP